jgi:hypothetical protein
MKMKIITIAIVSLAVSAASAAFQGLNIQEINENLIATFNGGPASFVTIAPTSFGFDITLSQGWTFDVDDLLFTEEIGEPEGGKGPLEGRPLENFLTIGETSISWASEHEGIAVPDFFKVETGLLKAPPPSVETFDVRVADVPESGFTLSLLGIGLAGLAWFARFRRTAI